MPLVTFIDSDQCFCSFATSFTVFQTNEQSTDPGRPASQPANRPVFSTHALTHARTLAEKCIEMAFVRGINCLTSKITIKKKRTEIFFLLNVAVGGYEHLQMFAASINVKITCSNSLYSCHMSLIFPSLKVSKGMQLNNRHAIYLSLYHRVERFPTDRQQNPGRHHRMTVIPVTV